MHAGRGECFLEGCAGCGVAIEVLLQGQHIAVRVIPSAVDGLVDDLLEVLAPVEVVAGAVVLQTAFPTPSGRTVLRIGGIGKAAE